MVSIAGGQVYRSSNEGSVTSRATSTVTRKVRVLERKVDGVGEGAEWPFDMIRHGRPFFPVGWLLRVFKVPWCFDL